MEIASLSKYLFFQDSVDNTIELNKAILFFTPCEELEGGSIFSKLASNYNVI